MAKLTLDSRVTGNEAMLLLEALNTFLRTEDPTVAFSNRELTVLLGEAAGRRDYDVLSDFPPKAISEMVVFEDDENEFFAIYPLVERIVWHDGTLFVRFDLSARPFIKRWMEHYISQSLKPGPQPGDHYDPLT